MILVIDNYDSFTYNLVQYLGELGTQPLVRRNNEVTLDEIAALKPERIVISPGPGSAGAGWHHARRDQEVRSHDAVAGRVPRASGHRDGVRGSRCSCDRADARQDLEHHARRPGGVCRHRDAADCRALSLAGGRSQRLARRAGDFGADRGRRHGDGAAASHSTRSTACSSTRNRS